MVMYDDGDDGDDDDDNDDGDGDEDMIRTAMTTPRRS